MHIILHRAESILKPGNVDAHAIQESQNLSIFFATNSSITTELKKHLEEVNVHIYLIHVHAIHVHPCLAWFELMLCILVPFSCKFTRYSCITYCL